MNALKSLRSGDAEQSRVVTQACLFDRVCAEMPVSIRPDEVFAGTQDDDLRGRTPSTWTRETFATATRWRCMVTSPCPEPIHPRR
jgi:hypothetical protein